MIVVRPIINVLGKLVKLPKNSYLDPTTLGSGATGPGKYLRGDGVWTDFPTGIFTDVIQEVYTDYTILNTDDVIICNSPIDFNLYLPTAIGIDGKCITINNINNGIANLIPFGTQTMQGDSNQIVYIDETFILMSNGSNWLII